MIERCEHCGAKIVKYWHSLNKGLCAAMIKIYRKHELNPVKISDLLTHSQVCNFQKLKYWGFVEKVEDEELKGGYWRLTLGAGRFIRGLTTAPRRIQTYRGNEVDRESQSVFIQDIVEGYQYRLDYIKEAE